MESSIFSLNGKKILITGASSGIGQATAIECANFGADLILVGRDESRLAETLSKCAGGQHVTLNYDLGIKESIIELVENLPALDGIVFSAGIIKRLPIKFISLDAIQEIFDINFFSMVEITRLLVKAKKLKDESSMVAISSVGAEHASLGNISYMASKGAVNSFVKGLAFELARHKVRVNAVLPGMIKTNLSRAINNEDLEADIKRYPLGRYGNPEEVAYACLYLLSDASKWVTGTKLVIDGGLTLR